MLTCPKPSTICSASCSVSTPAFASALAYAWLPCGATNREILSSSQVSSMPSRNTQSVADRLGASPRLHAGAHAACRGVHVPHPQVLPPHALVKGQRLVELLHERVGRAGEAPAPQLLLLRAGAVRRRRRRRLLRCAGCCLPAGMKRNSVSGKSCCFNFIMLSCRACSHY